MENRRAGGIRILREGLMEKRKKEGEEEGWTRPRRRPNGQGHRGDGKLLPLRWFELVKGSFVEERPVRLRAGMLWRSNLGG